jgi:hypothetical protein
MTLNELQDFINLEFSGSVTLSRKKTKIFLDPFEDVKALNSNRTWAFAKEWP